MTKKNSRVRVSLEMTFGTDVQVLPCTQGEHVGWERGRGGGWGGGGGGRGDQGGRGVQADL